MLIFNKTIKSIKKTGSSFVLSFDQKSYIEPMLKLTLMINKNEKD